MEDATFLEIDDSIRTKNLLLFDRDRDTLNQQMDEFMKQLDTPSILVQPIPGVCVKTKTVNGDKVFVNICTSDKIPPPEDISDTKLFQLINDEVPAYTIPMSIGSERMEVDKSGKPSATYDVMINTIYFKKCQEKKHFMAFTTLVILSGVADKFNKEIDSENYVILKNRLVMGKLQQHRIENRKPKKPQSRKSLIEEVSHSTKPIDKMGSDLQAGDITKTGYVILREPAKGPTERLITLFDMPKSVSIEDIVVLINSDRINVTDEKACYSYDVLLPYILKADNARAFLDYNIGVLRIDIIIK
ncbi:PIH1 domain-containing protein 1 [Monomorium pharaonis]|uniref:PIH1 domain-containing protein 1 n=1 Tax=Monomorium pharaonis TaxID=307658 RepID=UPI00102E17C8|nr:PIH1 domain-containing protein 1 [Monomorium pharaonis]XP_036147367.1 PIH1 domain-containing protein 1 [Monomorium pharaonis]XP_036147368.1 PIH1 domain-containing protein 1 [Monomorium pharaonis]